MVRGHLAPSHRSAEISYTRSCAANDSGVETANSGECANHFGELLHDFPPQVSSRSAAAAWGCHIHNEVNKKLKKEMFDCNDIGDFYDCGCAEDDGDGRKGDAAKSADEDGETSDTAKEGLAGDRERDVDDDIQLKLEKEG